jgi:ABC-type molybdenum transport system ATPase subunit/photorepair protein PhrA
MPQFDLVVSTNVKRSARVLQLEGLFELAPSKKSELHWKGSLPLDSREWQIGMIVGPSGCGKSTLARGVFSDHLINGFEWGADTSIVDAFPAKMSIKDITGLLSQVGFSSPPSWLRPFRCLSNGEQFRVTLARAMAENEDFFVIDEFTSVVDRTVAQIGSAALAKSIRQSGRQMIAVGVHYDVIDWLQPDWVFEPHLNRFQWRSVQRRPEIELEIVLCDKTDWAMFKRHHYLDTSLADSARCYCALYDDRPVAFTAVMHWPHASASRWREHRTVCLPDFQGVGIGNALSDFIASMYLATGKPYTSVTSNPAMIQHRARSKNWDMRRGLSRALKVGRTSSVKMGGTVATSRFTASFDYVGAIRYDEARRFGVVR